MIPDNVTGDRGASSAHAQDALVAAQEELAGALAANEELEDELLDALNRTDAAQHELRKLRALLCQAEEDEEASAAAAAEQGGRSDTRAPTRAGLSRFLALSSTAASESMLLAFSFNAWKDSHLRSIVTVLTKLVSVPAVLPALVAAAASDEAPSTPPRLPLGLPSTGRRGGVVEVYGTAELPVLRWRLTASLGGSFFAPSSEKDGEWASPAHRHAALTLSKASALDDIAAEDAHHNRAASHTTPMHGNGHGQQSPCRSPVGPGAHVEEGDQGGGTPRHASRPAEAKGGKGGTEAEAGGATCAEREGAPAIAAGSGRGSTTRQEQAMRRLASRAVGASGKGTAALPSSPPRSPTRRGTSAARRSHPPKPTGAASRNSSVSSGDLEEFLGIVAARAERSAALSPGTSWGGGAALNGTQV